MKNLLALLTFALASVYGYSQNLDPVYLSTNGSVEVIEKSGDTLFIGGSFSEIGYEANYSALVNSVTNLPNFALPSANSSIYASISDGAGGYYIGGFFTTINGVSTQRVAHILPDLSLDENFNCQVNNLVESFYLDGNDLYIGGSFTEVNSVSVDRLIRVNATTGQLDVSWFPAISNGSVRSIEKDEDFVYAGGSFTLVNDRNDRRYFCRFSTTTAEPDDFISANSTVEDLLFENGDLYVGGSFSNFSYFRSYLAYFNEGENIPLFDRDDINSTVEIIIPDGEGGWYIGGAFSAFGNETVTRLIRLNGDGTLNENFQPATINSTVTALHLDGNELYLSGFFSSIGAEPVQGLARLNAITGSLDNSWLPDVNNGVVNSIRTTPTEVVLGGSFTLINNSNNSRYFAKVDRTTAELIPAPSLNSTVTDFDASATGFYAAGSFSSSGYYQPSLGLVDETTGLPDQSFPDANSSVEVIIEDGNGGYYIGGSFTTLGEESVSRLAHLLSDYSIDPNFSCTFNSTVETLLLDGNDLYVAGSFTTVNGISLTRVGKLNATTGAPDASWNPAPNSTVIDIADAGSEILIGGFFTEVDGRTTEQYMARISKSTGETVQTISANSQVNAFEPSANGVFIGGNFSLLGYRHSNLALISGSTLIPERDFPIANSTILGAVEDGAGGYYVYGSFSEIGGQPSQRVAHILSDGSVDPSFQTTINSTVNGLVLVGSDLYIGGSFTTVNGVSANRLARIDATTGELDGGFTPDDPNSTVETLAFFNGTLYAGGSFTLVGGTTRNRLAAFDTDGTLTAWDPNANSTIRVIEENGGAIFVGGSFSTLGGVSKERIAALDPTTGAITSFDAGSVNGTIVDMEFSGSSLFVGGSFTSIGGSSRQRLAELNASTGALLSLDIPFNSTVERLEVSGNLLGVGGLFTQVDGNDQSYFAEIDLQSNSVTARDPRVNNAVYTIIYTGSDILLGGNFNFVNIQEANRLAEYDPANDEITDFNIGNTNGTVQDILLYDGALYIAGTFTSVNSTSQNRLASLNPATGALNPLSFDFNSTINTLSASGNRLYAGGIFTIVDGNNQPYTLAINLTDNSIDDWNPNPSSIVNTVYADEDGVLLGGSFQFLNTRDISKIADYNLNQNTFNEVIGDAINGTVEDILLSDDNLYFGGTFTSIGGESTARFASYNLNTETLNTDLISLNSTVETIHLDGDQLYLGGSFTIANETDRGRALSYDLTQNQLTEWNPNFTSTVGDIDTDGSLVIVGGSFTGIGQQDRQRLASFSFPEANLTSLNPNIINGSVTTIDIEGDDIYVGGSFTNINGEGRQRLASLDKMMGDLNPLSLEINSTVEDLAIFNDTLYYVGSFTLIDGNEVFRAASYSLQNNTTGGFSPKLNSTARNVIPSANGIWVAGDFTRLGFENRDRIAAVLEPTGEILDFNSSESTNGVIRSIAIDGDVLYIGGTFSTVAGQSRNKLAALSRTTGMALPFDPNVTGSSIEKILVEDGRMYVGGGFTAVSGMPRTNLAEINLSGVTVTDLDLPTNGVVYDLEKSGETLYFSGSFSTVDGESRGRVAAINTANNSLLAFNPMANSNVFELELDGNLLYVGGDFSSIGGQSRTNLASLNATDASLSAWNPQLNGRVRNFDIEENYLFAGGDFTSVNTESAGRLTLIDKTNGDILLNFLPLLNSSVIDLLYDEGKLYAGGFFTQIGDNSNHPRFARWSVPPPGTVSFEVDIVSTTDFNGFDVACNGDATAEVEISVSSGTAPYNYTLTNSGGTIQRTGVINSTSETATESDLPAGNYTITVEDNTEGLALGSINLTEPAPLDADLSVSDVVTTEGGSEASIEIDITGGQLPYDYVYTLNGASPFSGVINSIDTPTLIEGLSAGNYVFSFTDENGCTTQASITVNDYTPVSINFTIFDEITCNGDDDGRIRIQVFDGLPPYSFDLDSDDDNFDRSGTINGSGQSAFEDDLGPGTFVVTVTDATGAQTNAGPIELIDPAVFSVEATLISNESFDGANDGEIQLTFTGGVANYFYTFTRNGSFYSSGVSSETTDDVENLPSGIYVFTITDANGCQFITDPVEVLQGVDPCAGLGGDSDGDGICDDLDPCPFLANLENGDNCGNNGTVIDCQCVEGCQISLGTPSVTCLTNTGGADNYQVSIPYFGIDPTATIIVGNAPGCFNEFIALSGDDPSATQNGTIILTTSEATSCWSISISSALCDLELSGNSPSCDPPPCGLTLGTPSVECLTETEEADNYTVTIPYFGIAPDAVVTVGNTAGCFNEFITLSGDDPTLVNSGTIVLTSTEATSCWSISIQSESCDLTLEGSSPSCEPGVDCPGLGLNNGDPCGTTGDGTVVNCECLFPDCNGTLGGNVGDADEDGICDDADNCVNTPNPDQADLDGDDIGDVCDNDIDGDGVNNTADCAPLDPDFATEQIWYADNDEDGFGNPDESLIACEQPDGFVNNAVDCDDENGQVNPNAQTLTFTGTGNFTNSIIEPQTGSPSTVYTFSVVYTDATGALPPIGFPRAILDFEGNGNFTNPNDRTILLTPANSNDLNTTDGKVYTGTISSLAAGSNYTTRIRVADGDCLTEIGPFDYPDVLTEPDLEIFADDITFSEINPDVSSPLQVTALIRNASDLPASNFSVDLVNQFDESIDYPEIVVSFLPANGTTMVSWDIITPDVPAWCPMEVFVDNTNVINESNELDNRAVRPFVNGDFEVPGDIVVDANVNPAVQESALGNTVTIFGFAEYIDTAILLDDPSVAGGTVTLETEQGATYTGLTNSLGYFSITIPAPLAPGVYTIDGEVTDFTLTGDFTVEFEITEPVIVCLPDLRTFVDLAESQIFVGESTEGSITVTNNGCAASEISTLLDVTQTGGNPILSDETVPPLQPGESMTFELDELTFNATGTYTVCGTADANFEVVESNESNNTNCDAILVVPALPDIFPIGGPIGSAFLCTNPANPTFTIRNGGYVPSGAFDYEVDASLNGVFQETFTGEIANLDPSQSTQVTIPFSYNQLGSYTFQIRCDVPLPNGQVVEISETNNVGNYNRSIVECQPDLRVLGCRQFEVNPVDPEFPGQVTYVAQVRNDGNATATQPITFEFQVSNGEVYEVIIEEDLAPNQQTEVAVVAPTVESGLELLTGIVDPDDFIEEFSEINNSYADSLCWEFAPVPKCGFNFWNATFAPNQTTVVSVGLDVDHLYKASEAVVRFEVEGPGIAGTALLGDVAVENAETNCNCPYVVSLPNTFLYTEVGTYTFTFTADPDGDYAECDEENNVLQVEVEVTTLPDMRILSEFINPTVLNPALNESVFFDVTYENIGVSNPEDEMDLRILVDEVELTTIPNVSGLIQGTNTTVTIPVPYSTDVSGAHIVRAIIDSQNEIAETNELNNEATRAIVVGEAANLFFEVFQPDDASPMIGQSILIDAVIGNNGALDVAADVLFSYVNNAEDTVQIGSLPVDVEAGGSQAISLPWNVLDNNTVLLGEIVNASEIEFNYDDNFASANLGSFDVIITSLPFCDGESDGSLMAIANGGTPPYIYSWSTGFVGATLVAAPGTYSVTVTDSEGFEAMASGTIGVDETCVEPVCNLSAVSFTVADNCDPITGLFDLSLTVSYENEPESGFISVNGQDFEITGSPQSFDLEIAEGPLNFDVSFTENEDCSLMIMTGVVIEPCTEDCEGVFGGDALPGTECIISGESGIYDEECNCIPQVDCSLIVNSFDLSDACDPETGLYTAFVELSYSNAPAEGVLVVNDEEFEIDESPQTVELEFANGEVTFEAFFSENPACNTLVETGIVLEACEEDCEGVFGGDALPGTTCELAGAVGIYNEDCECVPHGVCTADGGEISTNDPTTICKGDGNPDPISVDLDGAIGENGIWLVTSTNGLIVDITEDNVFDFENTTGTGVCVIWHLSWDGEIFGLEVGANAFDLEGECFDLSNPLEVMEYYVNGGEISTDDPTTFCTDDGIPDNVTVIVEGNSGLNGCYAVTDSDLNIIQVSQTGIFDFEGNGEGVCLIWYASYSGPLTLPDEGTNIADIEGCFSLSNSIEIYKEECDDPIIVDCDNWRYFLSDSESDDDSDIYEVVLDEENDQGILTLFKSLNYQVHIAYNESTDELYLVRKSNGSFRTLDVSVPDGALSAEIPLDIALSGVINAAFDANGNFYIGSQNTDKIYQVNTETGVATEYADAPIQGGDFAFATDGELYHVTRDDNGRAYKINPGGENELLGSVPDLVTGLAARDDGNLMISTKDRNKLYVGDTDAMYLNKFYTLVLENEVFFMSSGDMASGCADNEPNLQSCNFQTYYYANHGDGIDGTDVYQVEFSEGEAQMTFVVNLPYQAHIAQEAEQSSQLYLVNANGNFLEIFDTGSFSTAQVEITGDIDKLFAVVLNPMDGLLYVGDDNDNAVYTINPFTGETNFFADAPINGGDLAVTDGEIYLAKRDSEDLFKFIDGSFVNIGSIPSEVNGMASTEMLNELITSSAGSSTFSRISAVDGGLITEYTAILDGEVFTLANGDMASGCLDPDLEPVCMYQLFCAHQSSTGINVLLSLTGNGEGGFDVEELAWNVGDAHIGVLPNGNELFVVDGSGTFRIFNLNTESFSEEISIFDEDGNITGTPAAVSTPDGFLVVASSSRNRVYLVNPTTGFASEIGRELPVNGGDLVFDSENVLWYINRDSGTFYDVYGTTEFTVPLTDIHGAALFDDGSILLAQGDEGNLMYGCDVTGQELNGVEYSVPLDLYWGDLAGQCLNIAFLAEQPNTAEQVDSWIRAYPNPNEGMTTVTFSPATGGDAVVEIFDLNGRKVDQIFSGEVKSQREYRAEVSRPDLPNGIYIYRMTKADETLIGKFIISK